MPELPEVETVRKILEQLVVGKTIASIEIHYPKIIRTPTDTDHFKVLLQGETIKKLGRKGKYLLFYFEHVTLISHLRMEGKYIYSDKDKEYDKHTHIIFHFTDGAVLQYRDVRKFGTMDVLIKGKEIEFPSIKRLGQEPIDPNFNKERFIEKIKARNAPIKNILLNQEIVSGLGNIYVDDTLAVANIHPLRPSNSLTMEETNSIILAMVDVIEKAIKYGGSSIRSFDTIYGKGSMQDHLIVYGRTGKPCFVCGTPIEKIRVGGRGTHYCPTCQMI